MSGVTIGLGLVLFGVIGLLSPLGLIMIIQETEGRKKTLLMIGLIVFYPVLIGLFSLVLFVVCLLYPFLRKSYHHGVYDPFDQGLSYISVGYLKVISLIWSF